jgi:ribosome recycling factor
MEEEVQMYLDDTNEKMEKAINHLNDALSKIRAGKASPAMLNGVQVDYYGVKTPLTQLANVNTTDARTIVIQPWEKKIIEAIEKAILAANLGFNPMNNGDVIRINVPVLTEERRRDLVKQTKNEGEIAKVSIRNARRDVIDEFKAMKKKGLAEDAEADAENSVQKLTDKYIKAVDDLLAKKEAEILTI